MVRPEINDGAAPARRTRESGAPARVSSIPGTRAHPRDELPELREIPTRPRAAPRSRRHARPRDASRRAAQIARVGRDGGEAARSTRSTRGDEHLRETSGRSEPHVGPKGPRVSAAHRQRYAGAQNAGSARPARFLAPVGTRARTTTGSRRASGREGRGEAGACG